MYTHWLFMSGVSVITFALLLALVRWIGETQISQATYFNWVAGACMGNISANMLSSNNVHGVIDSGMELVFFSAVTIIASVLSLKNRGFRKMTSGEPVVLIHHGEYIYKHLKQSKINLDLLKQMLREQGYFNYENIEYAILEPTGGLSVLPMDKKEEVDQSTVSQKQNSNKDKRQTSQHIK